MRPEARGRFCASCRKHVHDLSAMTEKDARAFLAKAANADVCVSYLVEADARIRFAPAPVVPISRLRRPAIAAGLAVALAACAPHETPRSLDLRVEDAPIAEQPVVVPSANVRAAQPAPPVATAEPVLLDEPCDPPVEPIAAPEPHRVKGTPAPIRRLAGKPMLPRDTDPLAGL